MCVLFDNTGRRSASWSSPTLNPILNIKRPEEFEMAGVEAISQAVQVDPLESWVGKVVQVVFWDHTENLDHPEQVIVTGMLTTVAPAYVIVCSWLCQPRDPDCQIQWCIVRGAITHVFKYEKDDEYVIPEERV